MATATNNVDIFSYIKNQTKSFDHKLYLTLLGWASAFKEGDVAIGFGTRDEEQRRLARQLLLNTTVADLHMHPIVDGELQRALLSTIDQMVFKEISGWSFAYLKHELLMSDEARAKRICGGLSADAKATLIKLMSNDELIAFGKKVFHPLPNSKIGAQGYLSARLQPNSPTDHPEDILMSVLSVWSYGEGDLMLGSNPVSSQPESVLATELVLKDLVETFKLQEHLPWTVLAHIDIQAAIEESHLGATALWFQSIAGTDGGLKTFDTSLEKLLDHARNRTGCFGLYLEAGQGGDFTNGHTLADMVTLESYKNGLVTLLNREIEALTGKKPWTVINDVAGFIGPEVFKSKEQLLRCMLEDVVLGKMHGLTYGLDVCATLHMDVSVDDLREVYLSIMEVCPAYTMVLPYMNDPMLSYLTTGVHQLVQARQKFGFKRCPQMTAFFQRMGVLDALEQPDLKHFGDVCHMYYQYRLAKGDGRFIDDIKAEAQAMLARIAARGVTIAQGYGQQVTELPVSLEYELKSLVEDAKLSLQAQLSPQFIESFPKVIEVTTLACSSHDKRGHRCNRDSFINHPERGGSLNQSAIELLTELRNKRADTHVQIVISDGLNAYAICDAGHATPYVQALKHSLSNLGFKVAEEIIVVHNGRVRAGYHIGEILFGKHLDQTNRALIHVIGERPGTPHRNFSVYITVACGEQWLNNDGCKIDHDRTQVISGISDTALDPVQAAEQTVRMLRKTK